MSGTYNMADAIYSYMWGEGVFSPATVLKTIVPAPVLFLTHPVNTSGTPWGSPFIDQNGDKLPLGTLAGPNPVKAISRVEDGWGRSNVPGSQVYGNIDWRGPETARPDGTVVRMHVTWNGPQQRYFPDPNYDFEADEAYEVYYQGKYIAVTPYPVLGAAIKVTPATQDGNGNVASLEKLELVVICKNDSVGDVVYIYGMNNGSWDTGTLTSDVRFQLQTAKSPSNPLGYTRVFSIGNQNVSKSDGGEVAKEPDTPWFFNESCTKAVCTRTVEVTYHDYDHPNEEYVEDGLAKYTMDIGDIKGSGFAFEYSSNIGRYRWEQKHEFNPKEETNGAVASTIGLTPDVRKYLIGGRLCQVSDQYSDPDDDPCIGPNPELPNTFNHYYLRTYMSQIVKQYGSQVVAVDFDGDTLVVAKMSMDCIRSQLQELFYGVDCYDYYGSPANVLNIGDPFCTSLPECSIDDYNYCGYPLASDTPRIFMDGGLSPWIGGQAYYSLEFTNSDGDKEFPIYYDVYGTKSMQENGKPTDEFDNVFEYHGYLKRFIHFMDLRHPFMMSYSELTADEWIDYGNTGVYGNRHERPGFQLSTQIFRQESYAIDSIESTVISKEPIYDNTRIGPSHGFDWKGNMSTAKVDVGGVDWVFSQDTTYADSGDSSHVITQTVHEYFSETVGMGWAEGLDERTIDFSSIEPEFGDFYGTGSVLPANKWPSWVTFFNNEHYDDILDQVMALNYVDGSLAKDGTDWMLSYIQPNTDSSEIPGQAHNYINGKDSLYLFEGLPVSVYPIGLF